MSLSGKVALVTGASRGIGKGIALQLAQNGATVYITGRTLKPIEGKPGRSLEEVAQEMIKRGGKAIPVVCDHSDEKDIESLFKRIAEEQDNKIDILVNNCYSAVNAIMESRGKKFWNLEPTMFDEVNNVGLRAHYFASVYAARLMVPSSRGLIVNISSFGGMSYIFNVAYGVGKAACDRMAADCAHELRSSNVACVSLWPGAVKTETIMDNLEDMKKINTPKSNEMVRMFEQGESIEFPGKAIVHLAQDKHLMSKSGRILLTAELAQEYGFTDVDGSKPKNIRSLKGALAISGHTWTAAAVPGFIKIPFSILKWGASLKG